MSEWLKEHAWKACVGETLPWVRIPLSPPASAPGARVARPRELLRIEMQIAVQEMRVQAIRTAARPLERSEQPALENLKRRRLDVARPERRVDVPIVRGLADVDPQIAGTQLDVLVAADVF